MTRRVRSARLNGSLGGKQGSRLLSDEQREERARNAGNALLNLHGRDYFSFLSSHKPRKPPKRTPRVSTSDQPTKISNAAKRLRLAI